MSGGQGAEEFATILDAKLVLGGYVGPNLRSVGSVRTYFGGQRELWGTFGDHFGTLGDHLETLGDHLGTLGDHLGTLGDHLGTLGDPSTATWGSQGQKVRKKTVFS